MSGLRTRDVVTVGLAVLPFVAVTVGAAAFGQPPPAVRPAAPAPALTPAEEARLRSELVSAYESSRRATWLVRFSFHRQTRAGGGLNLTVTELNRPPDHLVSGLGGRSGRVAGRRITCSAVDQQEICAPTGPAESAEDVLSGEVADLRAALDPPRRWYVMENRPSRSVAGEPARCLGVRLVADVPDPPYGEQSEWCFAGDGVPLANRVVRREGTDERVALEVRRDVTDADVATLLGPAGG